MKFTEFQTQMRRYPLFTLHDLKLIFPGENIHTVNTQISLWAKQKKIIKLKNGLYILSLDYAKDAISPEVIASKLHEPSYISLQYALARHGIIPDAVFDITSVTTKRTRVFKTPVGIFRYRKIKTSCFGGFNAVKYGQFSSYMASPEKALVDYFYLNSRWLTPEFITWEELRLQNLKDLDFRSVISFAKKYNKKKLLSLINNLKLYAKSH